MLSVIATADEQVLVRSGTVLSTNLTDETIILDPDRETYYGVSDVAAYLWGALTEPRRVDDLWRGVVQRFDVDEVQARSDVLAYLDELLDKGLICRA